MFQVGHRWAHRQGLTLIGDAAHLMTPFAGVGVNVAMEDALSLANQIKQWKQSVWDKAGPSPSSSLLIGPVRAYEEEMFTRAQRYAEETMMYFDLFFHERGGIAMCEQFAKAKAEEKAKAAKTDLSVEVSELSLAATVEV
jgi:2-polyprenyl-6-methoxyphenol hydroxylase-like FAD-dependent oxidoreductase